MVGNKLILHKSAFPIARGEKTCFLDVIALLLNSSSALITIEDFPPKTTMLLQRLVPSLACGSC